MQEFYLVYEFDLSIDDYSIRGIFSNNEQAIEHIELMQSEGRKPVKNPVIVSEDKLTMELIRQNTKIFGSNNAEKSPHDLFVGWVMCALLTHERNLVNMGSKHEAIKLVGQAFDIADLMCEVRETRGKK
jgi:hypothetical protein